MSSGFLESMATSMCTRDLKATQTVIAPKPQGRHKTPNHRP